MRIDEIRTIFLDYQEDRTPLGVARLKKKLKDGSPFILTEAKESETVVYNYEVWEVEFLELTIEGEAYVHKDKTSFPIRYVDTIGIKTSNQKPEIKTSKLLDSFITFNGKEIF
jgi:hypothetical protein